MRQIRKLLSNLVGLFLIIFLLLFVYQNYTGRDIDYTKLSSMADLSKVSVNLSTLNIGFLNSVKQNLVSSTEKQAKKSAVNIVDKQLTSWKDNLLKGLINDDLQKDTGELTKKTSGDFKIAMLSDSHESFDNLKKTVDIINAESSFDLAVHLGDLSRVGEQSQLIKSKQILDSLKVKYYTVPGDHDFWDTVGPENYIKVFGVNYFSIIKGSWKLIFVDDADIDNGLDNVQFEWLKSELQANDSKYRVIFVHIPLYSTHSERRTMGGNDAVKKQKEDILKLAREKNVMAIVAGDQHYFNIDIDLEKKEFKHIVIGALTNDRNLQPARYGIVQLKANGVVEVKDIEL